MEWWMYIVAYVLLQPVFAGLWAMFAAGNRRADGELEPVVEPRVKAPAASRVPAHSL